jgi:hypothetical protein
MSTETGQTHEQGLESPQTQFLSLVEKALILLSKAIELAEPAVAHGESIEAYHHDFILRRAKHVHSLCSDALGLIVSRRDVSPIVLTRAALEARAFIAAAAEDAPFAMEVMIQETEACGKRLNKHQGNEDVGTEFIKIAEQLREQFKIEARPRLPIKEIFEHAKMTDEYVAEYHIGSLYAHGATVAVASQGIDSWRLPILMQLVQTPCHVTSALSNCINFPDAEQFSEHARRIYDDMRAVRQSIKT